MNKLNKKTICIFGNQRGGKTTFMDKILNDKFEENYFTTLSFDLRRLPIKIENKEYKINLVENSGQEKYRLKLESVTKYLAECDAIIYMYDITDKESFNSFDKLIEEVEKNAKNNCPRIIVGNKIDLEEKRQIKEEEGKNFAENKGMAFFEISVKTGENLDNLTLFIIKKIFNLPDDFSGEIIVGYKNINEKKKDEESWVEKFCCFYPC